MGASDMHRLTISYGPNADASWPMSLVLKFGPTGLGNKILMDVVLNLFLKEHLFYDRDMPNATGMPAPKCYFSSYGGMRGLASSWKTSLQLGQVIKSRVSVQRT